MGEASNKLEGNTQLVPGLSRKYFTEELYCKTFYFYDFTNWCSKLACLFTIRPGIIFAGKTNSKL
jgi:hypothetical protein